MRIDRWLTAGLMTTAAFVAPMVHAAPVVFSDSGAQVSDLNGAADPLAQFRAALGANLGAGPNPANNPGRREINWDAAGPLDPVSDPNLMPADQFNRLAAPFARGAQFSTAGSGFMLSRRCEQDAQVFPCGGSNILLGLGPDSGLGVNLRAFSEQRIFTPVGSNVMDVTFAVPGSPGTAATTSAFGAIFLDVEVAGLTSLEFFDLGGNSLGLFDVPAGPDSGFSFLGVQFTGGEKIARVRMSLGDMVFTGHGTFGQVLNDLVALDDFVYAEPQRIGEPSTLTLLGLAGLAALRSRRRLATGEPGRRLNA
jgi:hypothetical protein